MLWGEKPYYSLDNYLKQTFGSKTYKASLDAGFTCPNRDGTIGRGGCIFCSRGGSGEFAGSRALSITEQIDSQIEKLGSFHAKQYRIMISILQTFVKFCFIFLLYFLPFHSYNGSAMFRCSYANAASFRKVKLKKYYNLYFV